MKKGKPQYRILLAIKDEQGNDKLSEAGALWVAASGKMAMTGSLSIDAGQARECRIILKSTLPKAIGETMAQAFENTASESKPNRHRKPDLEMYYFDSYIDIEGKTKRRKLPLAVLWSNQKTGSPSGNAILPASDTSMTLRVVTPSPKT